MCVITIKIVQRMHFPANQYKRPREDKGHALVLFQCVTTTLCVIFVMWNQIQSTDSVQIESGFQKSHKSQVQDDSH